MEAITKFCDEAIVLRTLNLIKKSTRLCHFLQLHSLFLKSSLDHNSNIISHFILPASSISLSYANSFFHSLPITPPLFAWNTIIRAFSNTPTPFHSLYLFRQLQSSHFSPNNFTYPFVIKACARFSSIYHGGMIHSLTIKTGFCSDCYIGNALLRFYADCGEIGFARMVFDEMFDRDVVSWSSMIGAYVCSKTPLEAFNVFQEMRVADEKPNYVTLVSLLSACTKTINLCAGVSVHSYIIRNHIEMGVELGTALFEMYAKCGQIDKALLVFDLMPEKNLQSCTIMISALANHSRENDAISLFNRMEDMGLKPDSLSFSAILSACSHMGLVYEGKMYFDKMVRLYNIKPTVEHYGCMVDLLGRAGLLQEAYDIIKNMPVEPNAVIVRSFLGACRNHGWVPNLDDDLMSKLESELGANYVLAANLFSDRSSWKDANELRLVMKRKGLKKVPGCSWLEVQN
ncbi:putative pentatricopeptide [Medicago truncatula]|uniref:Putative pentatricopeptide n=1 Tax=Medicago truncatula TaxID=3880 RepID=A0A396GPG4_MEDTR|nr:pentatricopeptide repeat-containing protein At4g21065-like [Medicago truncatula]RHN42403.1 putative pentatricopeptide [Medicago truncatula]